MLRDVFSPDKALAVEINDDMRNIIPNYFLFNKIKLFFDLNKFIFLNYTSFHLISSITDVL